jgi:hypothetical protein
MKAKVYLTTPVGKIAIVKEEVVAISEDPNRGSGVKTVIWTHGQVEGFNIMESYDDVIKEF